MGFDDGQILLDSDNGAYFPGQTIYGQMVFDQGKAKTIHGIYISFKGFCKVHWTTTETRRVNNRTVTKQVHHESYEEYFNRKVFVLGNENDDHQLQPGHHEFNFDFPLPINIPTSLEADYGHIRYRVKAVMVTSGIFSSNKEKMAALRVFVPVNLNLNPYCQEPVQLELINSYCCWCAAAGSSEVRVKMPVGGYCPGQTIPLEVKVSNLSRVDIDEIKMTIKRAIRFEAVSRPGVRTEKYIVAQIKKGPVVSGTAPEWNLEMPISAMEIYNFDTCKYIDVSYTFKLSIEVSGCHQDADESHPIIFGNIPLVGFQDNVLNPLQDQMPKNMPGENIQSGNYYPAPAIIPQPQAVTAQPNGNYQQNTPYPGPQPYPGIQPYPNPGNQPYPYPGNQPYPNPGNQPYPNQPYPPQGNQLYPNQPYPIVTPYSDSGSPYPAGNLPQPSPVPLPGPEPVTKPAVTNSNLVKTEKFGVVVSGDGASVPLLPPESSPPPYPTGPPSSPYGAPSAPPP
ncbi:unnamed protein product [Arctia plantaginis]|uniref:Arrestin C-terminal-like domain-containing protein n=1 Tax=Arctia plantaginis TaxID=874455 RepID=A0A8S1BL80_ARCPL|nr:unnamed protein product [Arctia plantaginis]CAB3260498.1 unnamed protein product [Arctia plantaginis]